MNNRSAYMYYALVFSPSIFLLKELWVIGLSTVVLNIVLYFYNSSMLSFRKNVKGFNSFFWGVSSILIAGVVIINLYEESRVMIVMTLGFGILFTSRILVDMNKVNLDSK